MDINFGFYAKHPPSSRLQRSGNQNPGPYSDLVNLAEGILVVCEGRIGRGGIGGRGLQKALQRHLKGLCSSFYMYLKNLYSPFTSLSGVYIVPLNAFKGSV